MHPLPRDQVDLVGETPVVCQVRLLPTGAAMGEESRPGAARAGGEGEAAALGAAPGAEHQIRHSLASLTSVLVAGVAGISSCWPPTARAATR